MPSEHPIDDTYPPEPATRSDGLRHELLTPLTVIRARAQLMRRCLRRLEPPDRDRLLADLAAIEEATRSLAVRIDRLPDDAARSGAPPG